MSSPDKINLAEALGSFTDVWSPKVVGDVNETSLRLAKLEDEFVWHSHEDEDEAFLVLDGSMTMRFRDRSVDLVSGDIIIVPRQTEHMPVGTPTCSVLLIEPNTTVNTGGTESERRVENLDRLVDG